MKLKSFRGKLADGDIERIRLSTTDGKTGYKIHKFNLIATIGNNMECCAMVHSIEPPTATNEIDFNDPTLLAVGNYTSDTSSEHHTINERIVFDSMKFNQDIFISVKQQTSMDVDLNYYLELEQVKLSVDEATVATLKDMRGRE
tara:strand:- start:316 stop:747 length:432 start_codon:yes stop_codon:yes gene_type:complete